MRVMDSSTVLITFLLLKRKRVKDQQKQLRAK